MDSLDYGRRFIVDAFRSKAAVPVSHAEVESYLLDLHGNLEGERAPHESVLLDDDDGFSAAVLGAEANAVLHLFPALSTMSLQVFSRRDVLLSDLTRRLTRHFEVGRFESHLGNATKALPRERARLQRVLAGDRSYARIRVDDRLLAP
ncbi:MAG: hypothetical protein WD314_01195 [Trueperaceae bacterium]